MLNRILDTIDAIFIRLADPLLLIARLILGVFYVMAGFDKFGSGYAEAASMMDKAGIPGVLLPLVIVLELGGGLFMAVGFLTRLTCIALGIFTVAANLIFNTAITSPIGGYLVQAELTVTAGFVALLAVGAGRWSVDGWRTRHHRRTLPVA